MKNYIRDCHQQIKTIRKLILTLSDDLGDLSINRDNPNSNYHTELCDKITEFECYLHKQQEALRFQSE